MKTRYEKPTVATRAEQMFDEFRKFHLANPRVWTIFRKAADQKVREGRTNYSVALIIEEIRWHESMDGLKISNNHRAFYARMYHMTSGVPLFRLRHRPSVDQSAFLHAVRQVPAEPVPSDEEILAESLSTLKA